MKDNRKNIVGDDVVISDNLTFIQKLNPKYWYGLYVSPFLRKSAYLIGTSYVWGLADKLVKPNEDFSNSKKRYMVIIALHLLFIVLSVFAVKKWYLIPFVPIIISIFMVSHIYGIFVAIRGLRG